MPSTGSAKRTTFLVILVSESVNLLGAGMAAIAVTLLVYQKTNGASVLAAMLALRTLTSIGFSPFAGVIVDRFRQRHLLMASNSTLCASVAALFWMARSGHVGLVLVAGILVVQALADSVAQTLIVSVVRHLADDAELTRSNSLVYLVQSVPQILAPALGAWAFASCGAAYVLGASVMALLVSILLLSVFVRALPEIEYGAWESPFAQVAKGFSFIWHDRGLRRLQLSYGALNFFNGLSAAGLIAFVVRHAGDSGWGMYSALGGVGLLAGSLVMTVNKKPVRNQVLLPVAQATAAVAGRVLLAIPSAQWLWYLGSFGRNGALQITGGPMTAIWQRQSPVESLGVVTGCRRLLSQVPYPIGVAIGGFLYDWWTSSVCPQHDGWFLACLGLAELAATSMWLNGPVRALFLAENAPRPIPRSQAAGLIPEQPTSPTEPETRMTRPG